jgi:hypothetical protein
MVPTRFWLDRVATQQPYDWRRQVRGVVATQDGRPTKIAELPLTAFELPKWLVEPAVRSCRLFNTALDFIFYDVPTLRAALAEKDAPMQAQGEKPPSRIIDFDALSDPEGSLLLIEATTPPYVHKYQSAKNFSNRPIKKRAMSTLPRSPASAARRWEARPWLGTSRSRSKSRCWQSCRAMASPTSSCRDWGAGSPLACMISSAARH